MTNFMTQCHARLLVETSPLLKTERRLTKQNVNENLHVLVVSVGRTQN